jgi:hypothetical protein
MIRVIAKSRARGKTTAALRFLHESGGGTFIYSHDRLRVLIKICQINGFENINFLHLPMDEPIAIDDIEDRPVAVTLNGNINTTKWLGQLWK